MSEKDEKRVLGGETVNEGYVAPDRFDEFDRAAHAWDREGLIAVLISEQVTSGFRMRTA
jgi:hypothetical protein